MVRSTVDGHTSLSYLIVSFKANVLAEGSAEASIHPMRALPSNDLNLHALLALAGSQV